MREKPSIAAIVTCHNYGRYLAACLESVLRQTVPFSEIILVDDASDDLTPQIAQRYKDRGVRYERVSYLNVALSREHGIRLTTSEFLVCIDADDWILPEFTRELSGPLLEDPGLSFAYSSWEFLPENKEANDYLIAKSRLHPFIEFVPRLLRRFNYIDNCAMVRRSAWLGQDPSLSGHLEDWDQWLKIARRGGKGKLVRKRLFFYRLHPRPCGALKYSQNKTAARRLVVSRHRYEKYELSVVLIFQKVPASDDLFFRSLKTLQLPENSEFLFVNQTASRTFHSRLLEAGKSCSNARVISFPHKPFAVPPFFPGLQKRAVSEALARAWIFSKQFIEGKTLLALKAEDSLPHDLWTSMKTRKEEGGANLVYLDHPRVVLGDAFTMEAITSLEGDLEKKVHTRNEKCLRITADPKVQHLFSSVDVPRPLSPSRLPTAAAIVICHNYGRYLSKALDSLLYQTKPFDEVILVDDASSDETHAVWAAHYQGRVRYVRIEARSQMKARQAGVDASSSEHLAFLDADDWVASDFHEKLSAEMSLSVYTGLVFCRRRVVREGGAQSWYPDYPEWSGAWYQPCQFYFNHIPSAVLVRRAAWPGPELTCGTPITGEVMFGEDWEMTLAILSRGWVLRCVQEPLYFYRVHGANVSLVPVGSSMKGRDLLAEIRQRWLPYDLTLVVFLCGDFDDARAMLKELSALCPDQKKQVIVIDGMGGWGSFESWRGDAHLFFSHLPGDRDEASWKRSVMHAFQAYFLGKRLLFWDARYSANSAGLEGLKHHLERGSLVFSSARAVETSGTAGSIERDSVLDPVFQLWDAKKFYVASSCWSSQTDILTSVQAICLLNPKGVNAHICPQISVSRRTHLWAREFQAHDWPAVSIVIPVKNDKVRLRRLLESLCALDYPSKKLEILVVDNGSSDGSLETAEEFRAVRVLIEPGPGSYAARNRGIREARHSLIAFLDSDCMVSPAWLKEMVRSLYEDARIGAVAGDNVPLNSDCLWSKLERQVFGYCNFSGGGNLRAYGITMNILFRREVFYQCGIFDESRPSGSDVEMTWRMQLSSSWRLKVLKGSAVVRHFDAERLSAVIKRHMRLGEGTFINSEIQPEAYLRAYWWMPQTFFEIAAQVLLRLITPGEDPWSRAHAGAPFVLKAYRLMRMALMKLGYVRALRRTEASLPASRDFTPFVFFGASECHVQAPFFKALYEKASRHDAENCRVLAVDPRAGVLKSWLCLLLALIGGSRVWRWPRGVLSIQLWQIFPENGKAPVFARWNQRLNAWRVRRTLGLKKNEPLRAGGTVHRAELLHWQRRLGQTVLLWEEPEIVLSSLDSALAVCLLDKWNDDLDWNEIRRVSEHTLWPVVVLVRGQPGERKKFFPDTYDSHRLKIVFTPDLKRALQLLDKKILMLLYVFNDSAPEGIVLPEVLKPLVQKGIPVVTNRADKTGECSFYGGDSMSDESSLIRQIYRLQLLPVWTHSTPGSFQPGLFMPAPLASSAMQKSE